MVNSTPSSCLDVQAKLNTRVRSVEPEIIVIVIPSALRPQIVESNISTLAKTSSPQLQPSTYRSTIPPFQRRKPTNASSLLSNVRLESIESRCS